MVTKNRLTQTQIYPSDAPQSRVRWVDVAGDAQIELLHRGEFLYFTPEEAGLLSRALAEHAEACGFDYENN